jgi:hypothetical protein
MIEIQDKMLEEREKNLLLLEDERRGITLLSYNMFRISTKGSELKVR